MPDTPRQTDIDLVREARRHAQGSADPIFDVIFDFEARLGLHNGPPEGWFWMSISECRDRLTRHVAARSAK